MNGISVVIPVYNEEESIDEGYEELSQVLRKTGRAYELIYVDDGSKDATLEKVSRLTAEDPAVRLIEFRRNFGQTAALAAGFDQAKYEIVVTLDGDLQNDPREIPKLVTKLEEGFDLVAGWRKDRQDPFWNRILPSMIANWLISKTTNVQLHDYGCTLKAMTRETAQSIRLYGEMHRFIPALADEAGARIVEVPVNHRPRRYGTTKYGITRTFRVVLDLITVKFLLGFSKRPIHFFGALGVVCGLLGAFVLTVMTYQKLFLGVPMGSRPLLLLGVMLVIIGLQFLVFGLLAEVLARTYYESQNKPTYVIRRTIQSGSSAEEEAHPWKRKAAN